MRMKYFSIPALSPGPAEDELARFLDGHRILTVERHFVDDGAASYWAICVSHVRSDSREPTPKRPEKIDYRESLTPREFTIYSRLRNLRKSLADREGVPPYALFNNEQLAIMARERVVTRERLASIEGVGPARIEKYGDAFLGLLSELHAQQAEGSDATA